MTPFHRVVRALRQQPRGADPMSTKRPLTRIAVSVLQTIRWYARSAGRGPTFAELRACRERRQTEADVRRGLAYLKRRRLVSWTPAGPWTRYDESRVMPQ